MVSLESVENADALAALTLVEISGALGALAVFILISLNLLQSILRVDDVIAASKTKTGGGGASMCGPYGGGVGGVGSGGMGDFE